MTRAHHSQWFQSLRHCGAALLDPSDHEGRSSDIRRRWCTQPTVDSRNGARSGVGGVAVGSGGTRSALAQLVHAGLQQTPIGRLWALWKGSVPFYLQNHQPGQLRVPWKGSLPFRTPLPLLASAVLRYARNRYSNGLDDRSSIPDSSNRLSSSPQRADRDSYHMDTRGQESWSCNSSPCLHCSRCRG